MAEFRTYTIILVVGMLVTGSLNTLTKKAQNQSSAPGIYGERHKFEHPWFQTLLMFYGEALCLIVYEWQRRRARKSREAAQIQDIPSQQQSEQPMLTGIFVIPTVCDLIGTTLSGIGLLYVPASVWQMLRGAIIIFAGILSVIFLKRKLYPIHWLGMGVTMVGLGAVGLSSVLADKGDNADGVTHGQMILGIILILAAQLVSASQMVIEEIFIKKHDVPPIQVVGMEGCFGVIFMSLLVLPVCYFIPGNGPHGSYENSLDAISQMWNNGAIMGFGVAYLFSISFYNYFGLSVTKSLTAVHRTLIDACRTILVWVLDLIIHYCFIKSYGEAFDTTYGYVQLAGFSMLMLGTVLYNELIYIPCLGTPRSSTYPEISADFEGSQPLLDGSLRAN